MVPGTLSEVALLVSQCILCLRVSVVTCTDSDFMLHCQQETPVKLFVAGTSNMTAETQRVQSSLFLREP